MKNILIISIVSILTTGCGDDPLCAKKSLLITQVAEGISHYAGGTGTRSDLLKAQSASKELSEVAEEMQFKNITCKNN